MWPFWQSRRGSWNSAGQRLLPWARVTSAGPALPKRPHGANLHVRMATATLGAFFLMARRIAAACAIAFTQPRCGLSIAMLRGLFRPGGGYPMTEERAVLAGGCFWGMQALIRRYDGVKSTRVGFSG